MTNLHREPANALAALFEVRERAGVGRLEGVDGQDPLWGERHAAVADAGGHVGGEGQDGDLGARQGFDLWGGRGAGV